MTLAQAVEKATIDYLRGVLAECGGRSGAAAKIADVNRTHVYKLLKRHGIEYTPIPRSAAPPRNKKRTARHMAGSAETLRAE